MKKSKIWIFILILLVLGTGVFIFLKYKAGSKKISFTTVEADEGRVVSTVVTTGKLQAVTTVEVGTQVSGKIQKLYVDFNSKVKSGDILAQIDPDLMQAQRNEASASLDSSSASLANSSAQLESTIMKIKTAQADVQTAQAKLEISRASYKNAQKSETSAEANLGKAQAQLENVKLEYDRAEGLFKQDFVSQSERDLAYTQYKVALADLEVAKSTLEQSKFSVQSAKLQLDSASYDLESAKIAEESQRALAKAGEAQVRQSQAQVRQTQGKLEQADVNLGYTVIYSPIDGIVTDRSVDVGQTVASSFQTPRLFEIAQDLKNMEVIVDVDEADIGRVKEGMRASFTVDAYPDLRFRGKIKQVRAVATETSGVITYQVVVSANNDDLKLMPGMTANITIVSEVVDNCLRIPNAALRFKPENVTNFPYPSNYGQSSSSSKNGVGGSSNTKNSDSERRARLASSENDLLDSGSKKTLKSEPKLSSVWVLQADGNVREEKIEQGLSNNNFTEMKSGKIKSGDQLITAVESKKKQSTSAGISAGPPRGGGMRI